MPRAPPVTNHTLYMPRSLRRESRYVGSVRAVNAQLLDSYLLKSLDGGFADDAISADKVSVHKCGRGLQQKCLFRTETHNGKRAVLLGQYALGDQWALDFVSSIRPSHVMKSWRGKDLRRAFSAKYATVDKVDDFMMESDAPDSKGQQVRAVRNHALNGSEVKLLYVSPGAITDANVDSFVDFTRRQDGIFPLIYDELIRAVGWKHDSGVYDEGVRPILQANGKYAVMDDDYQSVNVPGMYFAGALAHGKDFKKAAGGFIHGFRYTARVLFNILMKTFHATTWPGVQQFETSSAAGLAGLTDLLFSRINTASAPYQMVGVLGDGIVFRCGEAGGSVSASYVPEVPVARFNAEFANFPRVVFTYGYNQQRRGFEKSATSGTQFQVWLWYYPAPSCHGNAVEELATNFSACEKPRKSKQQLLFGQRKEVLRMVENLHTNWSSVVLKENVNLWLRTKLGLVESAKNWVSKLDGDGSILAPQSATPNSHWNAGAVDMWVKSELAEPVLLFQNGNFVVKVEAGYGGVQHTHDLDQWQAKTKTSSGGVQVHQEWTVDVGRGIVQDVLLRGCLAQ